MLESSPTYIRFNPCRFQIRQHTDGGVGPDPRNRNIYSAPPAKPARRALAAQALDHDRGPPPAAAGGEEHGLPEVLQHGAKSIHQDGQTRGALC